MVPARANIVGGHLWVTNSASSGPGSLAQAMQDAYDNFGSSSNVIQFVIPGPGVHSIVGGSPQSAYLRNTLIDGYSQPGSQPNTLTNGDNAVLLIEVRGQLSLFGGCTVRGLVINSSSYAGISLSGDGVVEGNFIGTDPRGTVALGNANYGVYVASGNVRIGGPAPSARNLISANRFAGVAVYGAGTSNVIQGNLIGTDASGMRPLGNALYGIVNIANSSPSTPVTQIGGVNPGDANVIAYNGLGVWIEGGQHCAILGNSIFANEGLGIDLGTSGGGAFIQPDGPTLNHPGGTNAGPNFFQNHPVLTSVAVNGGTTVVQGTLNSAPNGTYRLEFYGNDGPDPSGFGPGRVFLVAKSVTTDGSGNVSFSITLTGSIPFVAATATDASGNTSEFSANLPSSTNGFGAGDLLVALNNGLIQWRRQDGTLVKVLDPGFGWNSPVGGMTFDRAGTLYVTGQTNFEVVRFSSAGQPLGVFSTNQYGYSSDVFFDALNNMWVSSEYGDAELAKYNLQGHLLAEYDPAPGFAGLYHAQLGADQRTVYYSGFIDLLISTPEIGYLGRYDLATGKALPVVYLSGTNANPPGVYGFRVLADGGALLSIPSEVLRVNNQGQVEMRYTVPGEFSWDPVALDIDGRSFWAGSSYGPVLYKFDMASGAVLQRIDTGSSGAVSSIAIFGEPVASDASLFLGMSAGADSVPTSQPLTYTLTLLNFRTNAANGVVVTDTIPDGAVFNSANTSLGTFAHNGAVVTFTLPSVPSGGAITMSLTVTPSSIGQITNSASLVANGTDPNPVGHSSSVVSTVIAAPGGLTVNNLNDSGAGSFRAAIQSANASAGGGTISFNLGGPGPYVLQPGSALPPLVRPITIDGYTQQGAATNSSSTSDNASLRLFLDGSKAGPFADGLVLMGGHSTVRGLAIGNFSGNGLVLTAGSGNAISGNFIGTDVDGSSPKPNAQNGILISDSFGNTIGGQATGSRNVVSANGGEGIGITGDRTGGNVIEGNFIGTDRTGAAGAGNGTGGLIVSAPVNLIGGTNVGSGNIISFNNRVGVEVFGVPSQSRYDIFVPEDIYGVGVLQNSIFANAGLGIDLAPPGVTVNDSGGDSRDGPNELLNFPVLSPIVPGSSTVTGSLATIPDANILIQVYASPVPDSSGYGQGQTFIGSAAVATDSDGNASFTVPVGVALVDGKYITATSTALADLDTSEFSQAVRVSPAADLAVTIVPSASPAPARQNLTYTITVTNRGPGTASAVLLTEILPQPVVFVSADGDGTNDFANTQVGWLLGNLAAGASTNLHVVVVPKLVGSIVTTAQVHAKEFEPTPLDDEIAVTTTVSGSPRTLVVSNTNDDGPGSFRAALTDLNANGYGLDTITFDIAGSGLHTITPSFQLPSIQVPVVIDGYTQPGAHPNTLTNGDDAVLLIELRGTLPPNPNTISGVDGLEINAGGTTVRGLIIDRFRQYGLYVYGYGAAVTSGVVIEGNFIGITPSGTAATNGIFGIDIESMDSVFVGGATPGARNIISGIGTFDPSASASSIYVRDCEFLKVQGNYLGTDASGQLPIESEGNGVDLYLDDNNALIGGTNAGVGNVIAYNRGTGVVIGDGTNNAVLGNSIFGNVGLGIHLGFAGQPVPPPTLNHPLAASGPNNLQNYPVLTSVVNSGSGTTIQGFLVSSPNRTFRVEFFANTRPHPSFHGEGQTFLGATSVTTDANGQAGFTFVSPVLANNFAATATDFYGNTSEFSVTWFPSNGAYQIGDLFIGDAQGQIQWRRHDGAPVKLLNTGFNSETFGLGFDSAGNLVAAEGGTNFLVHFDNRGNFLGTLSSNVVAAPQSISFDGVGSFYVGNASFNYYSPGGQIWKFGAGGNLLNTFNIAGEHGGAGWIDLGADQHTLYYTSYGQSVKRFDVASKAQLPDLTASLPYYGADDLRVLGDGGVIVAVGQSVVQVNAAGNLQASYGVTGEYSLTSLALDPDGNSFWASSQSNPFVYQFQFQNTNAVVSLPVFTQGGIGGLAVFGEPRAAARSLPVLSVAPANGIALISWANSFSGYTLQSTTSLSPANWTDLTTISNRFSLPMTNVVRFFRLIKR